MVHPLASECVNYVTQRTESIMALFYLLTLVLADRAADSKRPLLFSAAAVLFCCLGMASKESMVTAPLCVLLYDLAFHPERPRTKRRKQLYAALAATWILLAFLMASGPRSSSVGFDRGVGAALELRPAHFETLMNLGRVLVRAGRHREALAAFDQAARIRPEAIEPSVELARVFATAPDPSLRDPERAVRLAKAASEIHASDPFVLDTLAAAYAALGRFEEARSTAQEALAQAEERGSVRLAAEIQARIELYALGRPYVELPP